MYHSVKTFRYYLIFGYLFVAILGTLSHFVYEWSGKNPWIAPFVPVNESIWEHMKLPFFPMLLYVILLWFYHQKKCKKNPSPCREFFLHYPGFWNALSFGIIVGSLFLPIAHYSYSGILGFSLMPVDIALFYLGVLAAFSVGYLLSSKQFSALCSYLILFGILLLFLCFVFFTKQPPQLGIFDDPTT